VYRTVPDLYMGTFVIRHTDLNGASQTSINNEITLCNWVSTDDGDLATEAPLHEKKSEPDYVRAIENRDGSSRKGRALHTTQIC
jgi:hypothetical protein